jgi:aquaporin Z
MATRLIGALRSHWPEYLIEGCGIGVFMVSALSFTVLLEHPASPVRQSLPDALARRALMGSAMGLTAIALVYSPWGKQSGAHFNPALTLTFFRLGKIEPLDALFYAASQFVGAVAGVGVACLALRTLPEDPSIRFAVTVPGSAGELAAFAAEIVISFGLVLAILSASNARRIARFTGLIAGLLIATYITLEAPISGMSMNPARTLGSAAGARAFPSIWIYFTAPPVGMLLAAETYVRLRGARRVLCAKLHHENDKRCIFRCGYHAAA